jgi:hypothetical protein
MMNSCATIRVGDIPASMKQPCEPALPSLEAGDTNAILLNGAESDAAYAKCRDNHQKTIDAIK